MPKSALQSETHSDDLIMQKLLASLQLLAAALLALTAVATIVNLVLISTRPETISVVNTIIGQGLLAVCLAALARILLRKGWRRFNAGADRGSEPH